MHNEVGTCAEILPYFPPGNRDEVFIWQNFQPAFSYEHIEAFTKDLEAKQHLGNQDSRAHMKRP